MDRSCSAQGEVRRCLERDTKRGGTCLEEEAQLQAPKVLQVGVLVQPLVHVLRAGQATERVHGAVPHGMHAHACCDRGA